MVCVARRGKDLRLGSSQGGKTTCGYKLSINTTIMHMAAEIVITGREVCAANALCELLRGSYVI
jgi:hypothetical protein